MKRLMIVGLSAVALVAVGAFVWLSFIRDEAPDAFELSDGTTAGENTEESREGADDTEGTDATEGTEYGEESTADEPAATPASLDGTWVIAEGSEAGYRVVEDIGNITDFEAVGRTKMVTGSITIVGTSVTEGSFEVDVMTIISDDGRRDRAFQDEVMSVGNFPTANFVLTVPIELGSIPGAGETVSATATGDLTLRDQTNSVTFPVEAQLLGDQIEIVGAIDLAFSDFGLTNPSNPFVTVRDEGKVEVKLLLTAG